MRFPNPPSTNGFSRLLVSSTRALLLAAVGFSFVAPSASVAALPAEVAPPILNPLDIDARKSTSINLRGELIEDGGEMIETVGFVYAKKADNPNPVLGDPTSEVVSVPFNLAIFDHLITGLDPNTEYVFKSFATWNGGANNVQSTSVEFATENNDSTLSGLEVTSGTLLQVSDPPVDPPVEGFVPAVLDYTLTVSNLTETIKVTPTTPAMAGSTLAIRSGPAPLDPAMPQFVVIDSGEQSTDLALAVGDNTIEIRVTAQDSSLVQTYAVTVRRLSGDDKLSALAISSGTLNPVFDSAVLSYDAEVSNLTSSIKVTPTASDTKAVLAIRSGAAPLDPAPTPPFVGIDSGQESGNLNLIVGANTIEIRVTAEDNSIVKIYTITVTRQGPLELTATPTATAITASSATLGGEVIRDGGDEITERGFVYGVASESPSLDVVNLVNTTLVPLPSPHAVGAFSGTIPPPAIPPLTEGTNYVFKAFARNAGGYVYSSQGTFTTLPRLSALAVTNVAATATVGNRGELNIAFAPETLTYSATVSNRTETITITADRNQKVSTVTHFRVGAGAFAPISPGIASATLALAPGDNAVQVRVTAQDGTTPETYTVTVNRKPPLAVASDTTISSSSIGLTAATVAGEVTEDGGDELVRGVIFSETLSIAVPELEVPPIPGVEDVVDSGGVTKGEVTKVLTLSTGVTYSARIYAKIGSDVRYSNPRTFTTNTNVPFTDDVGQISGRQIVQGDSQRLLFDLSGPARTSLLIAPGSPNVSFTLLKSDGTPFPGAGPSNASLFDLNLPSGKYTALITNTGGVKETFSFTVDARFAPVSPPRPDVSLLAQGKRAGFGIFSPRAQTLNTVSLRAQRIQASAEIRNFNDSAKVISVRGSGSNRFFQIRYRFSGRNVTAQVLRDALRTPAIRNVSGAKKVVIDVIPNRKRLARGTSILRKTYATSIRVSSEGVVDTARLVVRTR